MTREIEEHRHAIEDNTQSILDDGPSMKSSFGMDVQVVLPLSIVGVKYRHRKFRREAVDLLLDRP